MKSFQDVLTELDEYTAAPKDGDYDRHTISAMSAVYAVMSRENEKMRAVVRNAHLSLALHLAALEEE